MEGNFHQPFFFINTKRYRHYETQNILARIDFQLLKVRFNIENYLGNIAAADQDDTKTKDDYVQFEGKVPAKAQGTNTVATSLIIKRKLFFTFIIVRAFWKF